MATQCPHCGTMLPRDDARFCNHCGNSISAFPQSASNETFSDASSLQKPPSTVHQKEHKPALREQIAQQPPSRSPQPSAQNEPPVWIEQLKRGDPKITLPGINDDFGNPSAPSEEKQAQPPEAVFEADTQTIPITEEEGQAPSSQETVQPVIDGQQPLLSQENTSAMSVEREDFPAPVVPSRPQFAGRELHVKVWEQEDTALLPSSEPSSGVAEDQPTRPLLSAPIPADLLRAAARPVPLSDESDHDQIEQLDTVQIAAYGQDKQVTTNPPPIEDQMKQAEQVAQVKENIPQQPAPQQSSLPGITPAPMQQRGASMPGFAPTSASRGTSMPGITPAPMQRGASMPGIASQPAVRRDVSSPGIPSMQGHRPGVQQAVIPVTSPPQRVRPRYPLIAASVLLPVLLLGLAIWIIQVRPFSVSPVSQPWQTLRDEKLGIALAYPNGWQSQVDHAKSTVRLADSTNTAQVTIAVSNAPGGDLAQYLSQQAKQMQMADAKAGTSVSFAHTTWTQIQGTTQQSGANYATTLLATVHNNRLFTITLLAPSSNYADQEKMNFSHMRNSWQFL